MWLCFVAGGRAQKSLALVNSGMLPAYRGLRRLPPLALQEHFERTWIGIRIPVGPRHYANGTTPLDREVRGAGTRRGLC